MKLSRSEPAAHAKVMKEWVKERKGMQAAGEKIRFNIWEFAVGSSRHLQGERVETRGQVMWKGYYLEWAQSLEGGAFSEPEVKNKWRELKKDRRTSERSARTLATHSRCSWTSWTLRSWPGRGR